LCALSAHSYLIPCSLAGALDDSPHIATGMIEFLLVALSVQLVPVRDTAYLEGQRVVIQPIHLSFRVPPLWLGLPAQKGRDYLCANNPAGTVSERIVTERARFKSLQGPAGEWKTEFSAVIDSVLPFANLVAQLGGDPWNGNCGAMQMRVYAGENLSRLTADATPGLQAARRFFNPVTRTKSDSAGWRITRLSWEAWYYDYGGTAQVEFWSRPVNGRDVVFVFMFAGYEPNQFKDRADIIDSVREQR
jgi:hypothetical protein